MDIIEEIYYPSLQNYIEANKDRKTKEIKKYVKIAKKMIKYYEDKRDTEEAIELIERYFYSVK